MKLDLHVHTNVSFDSKIKLGILLRKLKEIGLDGVAITNHDSIEDIQKAKEIAKKYDVKVFTGVEISTKSGHLLAYGVNEKPIYRRSIRETIDWIHDHNGIAVCAHPYRLSSPSVGEKVQTYNFDAIEINGKCSTAQNRAAEFTANMMHLPMIGGSDAHFIQNVGKIATEFEDEITTDDELIKAIRNNRCKVFYKSPISISAELIPPIPVEEITLLEKFKKKEKKPTAPFLSPAGKYARFMDIKNNDQSSCK